MKFHAELHLTIEGEIIKFTAYEILKIAMELVNTPANEEIFIPQVDSFDTLMEVFRRNVDTLSEDSHRLALVVPLHLKKMNTPKKWLYIAQSLAKQYLNNPLLGWWSKIGNNLIFIKNSDRYLFYVSDHGNIQEVFEKISDIVWGDVNWLDSDVISGIELVGKKLKSANYSQQFSTLISNLISSAPLQELRDFHSDLSEEDLQRLYAMMQNHDFLLEQYGQFGESTRYILNILNASYKKFVKDFPDVIKQTYVSLGVCDESGEKIQYENDEFWGFLFSTAQEESITFRGQL